MKLDRLRLRDFRGYRELELSLDASWVLLAGANAQGKTNLLEAIVVACAGRSPRHAPDVEMIRWGQERARITAWLTSAVRGPLELDAALSSAGREVKINGAARRLSDLIGVVGLVLFVADDLDIVKRDPAVRRRFLDTELGSLSKSYYWSVARYRRVLDQRNRLLKSIRDGDRPAADLASWDAQLAQHGGVVVEKRFGFMRDLASHAAGAYRKLIGGDETLELRYRPALGEDSETAWRRIVSASASPEGEAAGRSDGAEKLRQRVSERLARALAEGRAREIELGMTQAGPHRDDFDLLGGAADLRRFGSQGEQRTAAIALRLGLVRVVAESLGEPPLLLLDDVLSELDCERRGGLFEALGGAGQTIVTATDVDAVPAGVRASAQVWQVRAGTVTQADGAPPARATP